MNQCMFMCMCEYYNIITSTPLIDAHLRIYLHDCDELLQGTGLQAHQLITIQDMAITQCIFVPKRHYHGAQIQHMHVPN